MKQDKGCGIVIMDKTKYTDKCLSFLQSSQFKQLTTDPTVTHKKKNPDFTQKNQKALTKQRLESTDSNPGQFYGLAKIHKLKE